MLTVRRIDYYSQFVLGSIMLLSLPVMFQYGSLAGFFLIDCWQLFSASANTNNFISSGLCKKISSYWKWTGIIMASLFLCVFLCQRFNPDDIQILAGVAVMASVPLSIYYLSIYKRLINHQVLRNELSGIIKSK